MHSSKDNYNQAFISAKCCVIIPTYNNGTTLEKVVRDVQEYTDQILIVNDGSTDQTKVVLEKFSNLEVVDHQVNKGKGCALRSGFARAIELGYTHAITIDSDGQHFSEDIPQFLTALLQQPDTLFIGARNMEQASVPGKSSFGHKFSNFWFWFETGIKVPDTQSGFRLYPLTPIKGMRWFTTKYEFEIEVIVRLAWKGVKIDSVPVKVYYAPKEERISHFRPFQDFSRVSVLNVFLVAITLVYIKPLQFFRNIKKKSIVDLIKDSFFNPGESNLKKTFSVMFGIFMGIFPVWGYQLIIGIALAHLLKLNKVIFVTAAHISIPPMIPIIIFASHRLGGIILSSPKDDFILNKDFSLVTVKEEMVQYLIGAVALSIIASLIAGIVTLTLLKLFPMRKRQLQY